MPESFDKVIASLRYLDLHPDIHEYKGRFLIQKITFLTQTLGIDTDYLFTIYVSGPYSPTLTRDYYSQSDRLQRHETDYELSAENISCLEKIKDCRDLIENLSLMEATSTSMYLMKNAPSSVDDKIFSTVKSLKPYLGDATVVISITRAKKLLFKPEYLTADLKKEIDVWDSVES
jgi:uncharacterized protein YwgA